MIHVRWTIAAVALALAAAVAVLAQGVGSAPPPRNDLGLVEGGGDEPIHFVSDEATADHKAGWVKLTGNVVVTQGDSVLNCDELEIRYSREAAEAAPGSGNEQISEVIATGNVKMNQVDRNATCAKAHYIAESRTVVLTGDPTVWQDGNRLTGDRIEIFLETDRVKVFGAKGNKVRGTIIPGEGSSFLDVLGRTPEKDGSNEDSDADAQSR